MSKTDTAVPFDVEEVTVERVVTPEGSTKKVKTKVKKRKNKRGAGRKLLDRFQSAGKSLKKGTVKAAKKSKKKAHKGKVKIKVGAGKAVEVMKSAGSAAGTKLKRAGSKLYWSGAAVGSSIGRSLRFFGRSSVTLVRNIGRFLGTTITRGTGWLTRGVSWILRTSLESLFRITTAAFLVTTIVMVGLAFVHDSYENKVHKHAKAWSVGEYRSTNKGGLLAPAETQEEAAALIGFVSDSLGGKKSKGKKRVTEDGFVVAADAGLNPEKLSPEVLHEAAWDYLHEGIDFFEYWFKPGPTLPLPEEGVDNEILDLFFTRMQALHRDKHFQEARDAHKLTENQFFLNYSYWQGRTASNTSCQQAELFHTNWAQPWDKVREDFIMRLNAERALMLKSLADEFGIRHLHKNWWRKGWDHQVTWRTDRLHKIWLESEHAVWGPTSSTVEQHVDEDTDAEVSV